MYLVKIDKLSVAVLFLSESVLYAQEIKQDTLKKEKNIEGVVIKASSNKKTDAAVLVEQKKAIIQKQSLLSDKNRIFIFKTINALIINCLCFYIF